MIDSIIAKDLEEIINRLADFKIKIQGKIFLISGGAGFLGSWFCDVAILLGAKVICVDNLISTSRKNISHLLNKSNFQFIKADIVKFKIPKNVDYIVHMASIASPPLYQKYPIETLDSGILGIRNCLEYAAKDQILGFLYTSSSEVYGNPPDEFIPTPEDYYGCVASFGPRAMYDESKRAEEAYCYAYFSQAQRKGKTLPVRIARIFNTYGPRLDVSKTSQYGRALIKFTVQALKNEPITIYGDGVQTRSFCYVADQMIGLFQLLLKEDINGEVVNIGNDKETSIFELAELIVKIAGSKSEIRLDSPPTYDIKDDPRRRCPDISKAKKLLNFTPQVTLKEGLRRTISWAKDNLSPSD